MIQSRGASRGNETEINSNNISLRSHNIDQILISLPLLTYSFVNLLFRQSSSKLLLINRKGTLFIPLS